MTVVRLSQTAEYKISLFLSLLLAMVFNKLNFEVSKNNSYLFSNNIPMKYFVITILTLLSCFSNFAQKNNMMIRLSEIKIDSNYLEEYKAILQEESRASVQLERGVISIFPMFEKENPTEVRILEIYASREAYESHLKTPHFQKYKTSTFKMVESLKLIDMETIDAETMPQVFRKLRSVETESKSKQKKNLR
jgi:quinol monooxygenase YgiN